MPETCERSSHNHIKNRTKNFIHKSNVHIVVVFFTFEELLEVPL